MSTQSIHELAHALRSAYLRKASEEVDQVGLQLTELAAFFLARQSPEDLDHLVQALGPIIQVADARGSEKPGAQWRRLSQLASLLRDYPQELEIQRWLDPGTVAGMVLRAVSKQSGLSMSELSRAIGRSPTHVSNVVGILVNAGYLSQVSDGRQKRVLLSATAKRKLRRYEELNRERASWGSIDQPPVAGETGLKVFVSSPTSKAKKHSAASQMIVLDVPRAYEGLGESFAPKAKPGVLKNLITKIPRAEYEANVCQEGFAHEVITSEG